MKFCQKPGIGLICLALLITVATMVLAGCVDSAQDQQSQAIAPQDQQTAIPAAGTAVTTKTTAPPVKTTQAIPAPVSSTGVIKIDPIGDKKIGGHVHSHGNNQSSCRHQHFLADHAGYG